MTSRDVVIQDEVGLHARPAIVFVKTANRFAARLTVRAGEKEADAKSIVKVIGLGARKGVTITISAEGVDETEAVAALTRLVENDFAEA
ncbi:MAG: HPr family phosphocarrier protein [Ktedonobacterales bacterium]